MLKKKKYAKNVADNDDPDWGNLKKVEREGPDSDDTDKKVKKNLLIQIVIHLIILIVHFGIFF